MFDERGIWRQKRVTSNQWLRLLILWLGASCMTHVRWRETTRIHSQRINENTRQVQDSQRHLMAAGCQSSVSVKIIQRPVFGERRPLTKRRVSVYSSSSASLALIRSGQQLIGGRMRLYTAERHQIQSTFVRNFSGKVLPNCGLWFILRTEKSGPTTFH